MKKYEKIKAKRRYHVKCFVVCPECNKNSTGLINTEKVNFNVGSAMKCICPYCNSEFAMKLNRNTIYSKTQAVCYPDEYITLKEYTLSKLKNELFMKELRNGNIFRKETRFL